jgi:autotransporter translocation and assembly factor TamB
VKKLFKWIAYSAATLIVLLTAVAGLTQTQMFRNKLRTLALENLDSLLIADVYLGEIHGNLVSGFSIDSASVVVGGEQLLGAERIDLRYDLFEIPAKRITVSHLTLVRPRIALLRGRDSLWNFERMVRPTPDDSTSTPFNWPIVVDRFEIQNAEIRLVDSARLAEADHIVSAPYFVEYHDFSLRNFHLLIKHALVSPDEKRASISSLTFVADRPDVQLQKFSCEFRAQENGTSVRNLALQTSRSRLTLDAEVHDFNVFDGFDIATLKQNPVELSLQSSPLDLNELKRFISQIDFLDGKLEADLEADGTFGQMHVRHLDLTNRNSELHFAGTVSHLDEPDLLTLNIKCRGSKVVYADASALLSTLALPNYNALGTAKLDFDFRGAPTDFVANLTLESDAGGISTSGAKLRIGGGRTLQYDGEFALRDVNLAALLNDPNLDAKASGTIAIAGYGTSLDNLNATVNAKLDSSVFAGRRIGASKIVFASAHGKLEGVADLAVGSMSSELKITLDRSDKLLPRFTVDGRVTSLNLADFVADKAQTSDLTMGVRAEGTGLEWEKLNCTATFAFSSSRYRQYQIDSGVVDLAIDQRDPLHSSIALRSSIADFSIKGQFDLDYIVGLLRYEVENMSLAVAERFKSLDSTLATTTDVKDLDASGKRLAAKTKSLDATYELSLKNLEPFSILVGDRTFDAVGTIKGSLRGGFANLAGDAQVNVKEFFYGNADSGMLIQDGIATLRFNDLKPIAPLSELQLRIKVDAGKMHLNRTKLDTLNFGIFYDKEYAGFVVNADYEQIIHLRTNGQIGITDDGVEFKFSNLATAFKDFAWRAEDGASVVVSQSGLRVQNLALQRGEQRVKLNASLLTGGALDAQIVCANLRLEDLKYALPSEERDGRGFEGHAHLDVQARGTLKSPEYVASLRAEQVLFRGLPFGLVTADATYKDEAMNTKLVIDNRAISRAETPDLIVEGTLPINLALAENNSLLSDSDMNFTVQSDGLQMSLLDPLVPTFNELSGIVKTKLKVQGTLKKPNFTGTLRIEQCRFLFAPNNMYYHLDGAFEPSQERINFTQVTVRNIAEDNKPGREGIVNIKGSMAFRALLPSDFKFTIAGKLLVVNKRTRTSGLAVYGELPVETAPQGLIYTGNIERSLLRGTVFVNNSSLAFPPTAASAREDTFYIPMRIVNDTVRVVARDDSTILSRYFRFAARIDSLSSSGAVSRGPSFIDGLRYDLNVDFQGTNNEVRMIFNPATNEELVANITGKVAITEDGTTWNGILNVSRASYNFYGKRFDAEGTMNYTGDLFNPELNINAKYEGSRENDQAQPAKEENVVVIYKIKGTRLVPKPDISMTIDAVDYNNYNDGPKSDLQSDALTFILAGKFPLSRGERNDVAGGLEATAKTTLLGGASSLLTAAFSEFLREKTGFINSFEFRYDSRGADIRFGGTAFKGYWRYGGRILEDPFSNANFSILYSFGTIFEKPLLRNFMFELEHKVDTATLFGQIESSRKEVNSARFFYRFSF